MLIILKMKHIQYYHPYIEFTVDVLLDTHWLHNSLEVLVDSGQETLDLICMLFFMLFPPDGKI